MTQTTSMIQSLLWPMQSMVDFFSPPISSAPALQVKSIAPRFSHQANPTLRSSSIALPSTSSLVRKTTLSPVSTTSSAMAATSCTVRTTRTNDGRLLMSGRMRDVCAELDRLCTQPA